MNNKIYGVVFGHAIGDALGLNTEFMTKDQVIKYYKNITYENRIEDSHRSTWTKGEWTDDTDQLILVMRNLVNKDGTTLQDKLYNWYWNGFKEFGIGRGRGIGNTIRRVINDPGFLKNPYDVSKELFELTDSSNHSNGGVMRTSIIGCLPDINQIIEHADNVCSITHYSQRCRFTCVFISLLIYFLIHDNSIRNSISNAMDLCKGGKVPVFHLKEESHTTRCWLYDKELDSKISS